VAVATPAAWVALAWLVLARLVLAWLVLARLVLAGPPQPATAVAPSRASAVEASAGRCQ
jgi:hypothetical protein